MSKIIKTVKTAKINDPIKSLYKFSIPKPHKVRYVNWKLSKYWVKAIDTEESNYGILTGKTNGIIVLDIDTKDEGIEEFNKYIERYDDPDTYQVQTRAGGYHYYFKYTHTDPDISVLLRRLTNKSKYRGKGLDIRTDGGYIVGPGSYVHDEKDGISGTYTVVNNVPIIEMPQTLVEWLTIVGPDVIPKNTTKTPKMPKKQFDDKIENEIVPRDLEWDITDDKIVEMLDKLPRKYYVNYSDWLIVTTILKNMGKLKLWDDFSRKILKTKSKISYSYDRNKYVYDNVTGDIDINYLCHITKSSVVKSFKPYQPISYDKLNRDIQILPIDLQFLKFRSDVFDQNDTIIIRSCTGTGKTTHIAKQCFMHLESNSTLRVLSLVSIRTLVGQHIKSFKKSDINLVSYQDENFNINTDHMVICVNSLWKLLHNQTDKQLSKYIVFIDEVNMFLEAVTHNNLLDDNLKMTYILLMRLIKHAHKVILTDALISDAVFTLTACRDNQTKVFIDNKYLRFNGIEAIEMADENDFYDKVSDTTSRGRPYLFGSDSCASATKYYNKLKEVAKDPEQLILISSETNFNLTDAEKQLAGKQGIYTPSVVAGVDATFKDPQDVFIYIKGNSIMPSGSFQQTCRTRNIKKLYYHACDTVNEPRYKSVQDVEELHRKSIITSNALITMCTAIDEYDNEILIENTFFKLYCYNEYVRDIYQTNKNLHYRQILLNNGFNVSKQGEFKKIDKETDADMQEIVDEVKTERWEDFIEILQKDDDTTQDLIDADHRDNVQDTLCKSFKSRARALRLFPYDESRFEKYKQYIIDPHIFHDHNNIIDLIKDDNYINEQRLIETRDNMKVKAVHSKYAKINILRQIEKILNIDILALRSISTAMYDNKVNLSDEMFDLYKLQFKSSKSKPKLYKDLVKLYIDGIKNLTRSIKLITSQRTTTRKPVTVYDIDYDVLNFHIDLNHFRNPSRNHYIDDFKENI